LFFTDEDDIEEGALGTLTIVKLCALNPENGIQRG